MRSERSVVDRALRRRATLREWAAGRVSVREVCDAHPYLRLTAVVASATIPGVSAPVRAEASAPPAAPPPANDPVVAGASRLVGGRAGGRALRARTLRVPLLIILALTLLTLGLGWVQKAPCRVHPWTEEYQYTRLCYTDVFALYYAEGLVDGDIPYADHAVEYPVVIGGLMNIAAQAAEVVDGTSGAKPDPQDPDAGGRRATAYFDITWGLMALAGLVLAWSTARLAGPGRIWDAAMVAVAPALVLHTVTNWDLVAVALAGAGLVLWSRERPVWAGVLLGVATATKLYPLLFLAPLLLLCLRAGRLSQWRATAAATVGTAALVTLPVYLTAPTFAVDDPGQVVGPSAWSRLTNDGLGGLFAALDPTRDGGTNGVWRFVQLNGERVADWDSLWYLLQQAPLIGPAVAGLPIGVLNTLTAVLFAAALAAIGWLALRAARPPRLPQLLFLVVVAFLLTSKVHSPQYVLWLLPLAVLARPSWRLVLAWQAAEAFLLLTRFMFFIHNDAEAAERSAEGLDPAWFFSAVLLRDAVLVVFAALVVRDILRPECDPVRADGTVDDPAGGVLSADRA